MKKVLSIVLTVILILTVVPMGAFTFSVSADGGTYTDGYYTYTVTDGKATITDVDASISGEVVIPDTLGGYPVTSIGEEAFLFCDSLTSVIIPNSIASISSYAFYKCDGLTSVTIPDSVTNTGHSAFFRCNDLTKLIIADGSTSINSDMVVCKYQLTEVVIPDSVTSIGQSAFYSCSNLVNINIPNSVTSIGGSAFQHCDSLTNVTIPGSVTDIGIGAFSWCDNLTSVTIGNGVTSIGEEAFYVCNSLTSVTIPNSVTSIGRSAFSGTGLTSITIPDSVTNMDGAFFDCSRLTAINVDKDNSNYCSIDGVLFNKDATTLIQYPDGKTNTAYIIPDGVTNIGGGAFSYNTRITSITIPDSVTSIGVEAFYCSEISDIYITDIAAWCNIDTGILSMPYNYNLYLNGELVTDLVVPEGVTHIGSSIFESCSSLTSVTIPDSVISIGNDAFRGCNNLANVSIGDGVTSIGEGAFEVNAYYQDESNWENNVLYIGDYLIKAKDDISGSYTIKDGTKLIGSRAFGNCNSLTSINIPDSVAIIGDKAIYSCESLTAINVDNNNSNYCSIDGVLFNKGATTLIQYPEGKINTAYIIPDGVTNIGGSAFSYNTRITSITIPNSVTSIGDYAFYWCKSLTSITIPSSVTSIGEDVFYYCKSLTAINVDDNNSNYCSIDGVLFNKGATTLIQYPKGKTNTAYIIPNSVTSIGDYAFSSCSNLIRVTISDGVTNIGDYAFEYCTSLTSITIPNSVTSIGDHMFGYIGPGVCSLWHILYTGTEYEWNSINKGDNYYLTNTTVHYNALGNEILNTAEKAPTCVEDGEKSYICSVCNEEKIINISKLGHSKGDVINTVDVTCTQNGYTVYQCSVCDETFESDTVWAQGHTKGEVVNTVNATCTQNGYTVYQCSVCDETFESDTVWAQGHKWNKVVKTVDPTCIEKGFTEYLCDSCGESNNSSFTAPTGHTFENDICINCNKAKEDCIESSHNYENNCDETWIISKPNADYITITFSSATETERNYDYIYIYDMDDTLIGQYSGTELASKTITVTGNIVKIKLKSDGSNTKYGFALSDIYAYKRYEINDVEVISPENAIDNDAVLNVVEVPTEEITTQLPANIKAENALVYDIYFEKDGETVQPNGELTVKIAVPADKNGENCAVYHIAEDGTLTDMKAVFKDGYMVFTTNHFSYYALVEQQDDIVPGDANGDGKINGKDYALLLQSINGWDVTINSDAADVNGDGKLNGKDYALLLQSINGWDVELQ